MDPLTMLAIAQGAKSLFSKKAKQPKYKEESFGQQYGQQYQPADAQYQPTSDADLPQLGQLPTAPQYQPDAQEQGTGNALFETVVGRQLANYNAGRPILDQGYRNAVLGQAKRSFDLSAGESGNQVNEQYNKLNLLGATGHGQALGEVQRSRLQGLGDIEDQLTQAELQQLNNATQQGMSLQNAFAQRANDQFRNNLAGAEFNRGNATTAFGAGMQRANYGMQRANFGQQERMNAFNTSLQGYGANQRERQAAFGARQDNATSQQNLGTGLLALGYDAYKNRKPVGGNASLANSLSGARKSRGAWFGER